MPTSIIIHLRRTGGVVDAIQRALQAPDPVRSGDDARKAGHRLRRIAPYETDLAAAARERVPLDFQKRHGWTHPAVERAEELLAGAQEALAALGTRGDPLRAIGSAAGDAFAAALDAVGANEEVMNADGEAAWTPGLMQAVVHSVARSRARKTGAVMREVATHLAQQIDQCGRDRAFVLEEQDRMRRERRIPPEQVLINLSKYEAHLNRLLYQALHEIEALQSRRRGQPVHLARVQISAGG
ncbi:MAG: hypothetical protein WEB52_12020 [Dehalococcoidia bacterium]